MHKLNEVEQQMDNNLADRLINAINALLAAVREYNAEISVKFPPTEPANKYCRWPMCESEAVQAQAGKCAAEAMGESQKDLFDPQAGKELP